MKCFYCQTLAKLLLIWPKSLYKSCTGRHFYGRENKIWDGFGLDGNTEKNGDWLWATFEGGYTVILEYFSIKE